MKVAYSKRGQSKTMGFFIRKKADNLKTNVWKQKNPVVMMQTKIPRETYSSFLSFRFEAKKMYEVYWLHST